jgi:hypothetical protein
MSSTCAEADCYENGKGWSSLLKLLSLCKASTRVSLMMALLIACLCGVHATLLRAQPLPERRSLQGLILGANKLPVGGAAVTVRRSNAGSAAFWGAVVYTDARGRFTVPEAEEGTYLLYVQAAGFARLQAVPYELNEAAQPFEATLQRLASFNLQLEQDNAPVVSSPASVLMRTADGAAQRLLRSRTDPKGVIAVAEVTPGPYTIFVHAPGRGYAALGDVDIAVGARTEPVVAALKSGGSLRVTAQESPVAGADAATREIARTLGGASLMLTLKTSSEANATLINLGPLFGSERSALNTRDGDGTAELSDVPPGPYTVRLDLKGYGEATQQVEIKAGETAALNFALQRRDNAGAVELRVLVHDAKDQPVIKSDVLVNLEQLSGAADANQAAAVAYLARRARTDEKGEFTLYPLVPGNWRVVVEAVTGADGKRFISPAKAVKVEATPGVPITVKLTSVVNR